MTISRSLASILIGLGVLTPTRVGACLIVPPPIEETVQKIASDGVIIRGTVIQKINAAKRTPLIIRADQVFLGNPSIRSYTINNSDREYELLRHPSRAISSCDHPAADYPLGYSDTFTLEPVLNPSGEHTGRWYFSIFAGNLRSVERRKLLTKAATDNGRLQSALPEAF